MVKRLVSLCLVLTMVLFSSISIYAEQRVQGDFFIKEVVINGERIENYNLQYPFFLYNNNAYFPLTPEMGNICGFTATMDKETSTLKLLKTEPTRKNLSSNTMKNNNEDLKLEMLSEVKVAAYREASQKNTKVKEGEIAVPRLEVEEMKLSGLPVLAIGNYIFLPLKAMQNSSTFKWQAAFDPYFGIAISTKAGTSAASYINKKESLYNKGLVNYIKNYNGSITTTIAQEYVFLFKKAGEMYGVDEKLLMSVAHKESTFRPGVRASGGAVGMMQIMPSTGARYGLSTAELLNPKKNIDCAALIISERIAAYGGDVTKGLAAYNQGSVRVSRGNYSNAYSTRVLSAYSGVNNYLSTNGYGKGN